MKKFVRSLTVVSLLALTISIISCDKSESPKPTKNDEIKTLEAPLNLTCVDRENKPENLNRPIVIQVSLDGFRADYMQKINPPNLKRIIKEGIYSSGMLPSFPTHTYPNHFTLVTGRLPSNHGILSNVFYDKERKEKYDAFGESSGDGSWYQGDPIWNVVEKSGMLSHVNQWVGAEVHVNHQDPTCYAPYSGKVTTAQRMDVVIDWLKLPAEKRPHYINTYVAIIDIAGHANGPDSKEVKDAVLEADREVGRLWDYIQASDLPINLVITSDHGMQTNFQDKIVFLGDKADLTGFKWGDKGAAVFLYHDDETRVAEVYQALKAKENGYKVYLRKDIPAEYRLKNDNRVGDLLVVSEAGNYITDRNFNPDKPYRVGGGSHGWPTTNKSMHALFIAAGSNIVKRRTTIPEFSNIDVYPFVMELLGVTTAVPFDGTAATLHPYILTN
ncbi:alkaline phosphatase family protein [Bdellovibrio sp. qaytius]|nr:alkaline phosphatase family protein [Bdellovibrio sp. qaytius]